MEPIYLDSNATSRPAREVVEAMHRALTEFWANPSSVHRAGQAVRQQVELARHDVCGLLGCLDRELVITSGGTESTNLAIRGTLERRPERPVLVTSRMEHAAVRETAEFLESRGTEVVWLPHDPEGVVEIEALADLLRDRADVIGLVSVMWANNETGVVQPIETLGQRCREAGVPFHTDATQVVGKRPINVAALPIDLLSFAAHKFHGPKAVGGLYVRRGMRITHQVIGGPQERERRGGTENVPGIMGMGAAAKLARTWLDSSGPLDLAVQRDAFEQRVCEALPRVRVNSGGAERLWSTSNLGFPALEAEAILLLLSERGVFASAGAACSSGSLDPSPVLLAMGLPPDVAHGSVRFSLSRETTADELDRAAAIIPAAIERLSASMVG